MSRDISSPSIVPGLPARCVAEVFGTFLLVFFGCGVVHAKVLTGAQSGVWQVAIVWGLGVATAILVVGAISGAHMNPAITIAMTLWRAFPVRDVVPYLASQFVGAMVAAFCLNVIFAQHLADREHALGVTRGGPGSEMTAMCYGEYYPDPAPIAGEWLNLRSGRKGDIVGTESMLLQSLLETERLRVTETVAFLVEFIGTLILALVVFAVTDAKNPRAAPYIPVIIGLTVALLISILAPLTQACFNPARDFGPRLVAYFLGWGEAAIPGPNGRGFWTVYIVSPILGAAAGGALQRFCLSPAYPRPDEAASE